MGGGAQSAAHRQVTALRAQGAGPQQLDVRPATTRDIDAVLRLERASFSDPWSRASFVGLLGDPRVYFVVATTSDGVLAGYIAAWLVGAEGEIATIAVDPSRRRAGIGALLLDSAIEAARARAVQHLYLEVRESNVGAQLLYRSRGFSEVGRRRGYYRNPPEDARILRAEL